VWPLTFEDGELLSPEIEQKLPELVSIVRELFEREPVKAKHGEDARACTQQMLRRDCRFFSCRNFPLNHSDD
jgi:hypothetical protein